MARLRTPTPNRPRRRGVMAAEAMMVLPLFLLVALGVVGTSDLLISEQLVDEASGRAARVAALGGSPAEVTAVVAAVLGSDRVQHATVVVQGVDGRAVEQVPPGGLLEVRIEIPARYATTTGLARVVGDEPLVGRAVMQRE